MPLNCPVKLWQAIGGRVVWGGGYLAALMTFQTVVIGEKMEPDEGFCFSAVVNNLMAFLASFS